MLTVHKEKLRNFARQCPLPVRKLMGFAWDYMSRLMIWYRIVCSMRGVALLDNVALILSAMVSPLNSFRGLGRWKDPLLLADTTVDVSGIGRFNLRAATDDLWHILPYRESAIVERVKLDLVQGDVFVDAGANIGFYSVLAGKLVGPSGHVLAIEMMPGTANILRNHVSINNLSNVLVVEKALSDSDGEVVHALLPEGKSGQATISKNSTIKGKEFAVGTTTLDKLLTNYEVISLLKLDVEGVEELVLRGAVNSLARIKRVIFEDWGNDKLATFFSKHNFDLVRLDGNNCLALNRVIFSS